MRNIVIILYVVLGLILDINGIISSHAIWSFYGVSFGILLCIAVDMEVH